MVRYTVEIDQTYSRGAWRHRIIVLDKAEDRVVGAYHDVRAARDMAKSLNAQHAEVACG